MQTGSAILREPHRLSEKTTNLVGEQAQNFIISDRSGMAFSRQRELKDNAEGTGPALIVNLCYLRSNPIAGDARLT